MSVRLFFHLATLGLFFSLTACGASEPPPTPTPEPEPEPVSVSYDGTILALGDSLTEGLGVDPSEAYPSLLAEKLSAAGHNYEVINAGISGETSTGAVSRLDWVLNTEPDIVILETGANDGLRGIDPVLTEENLHTLIDGFQAQGAVVVLAGMQTIQNLGEPYTSDFAAIYPRVAEAQDVVLIPFFLEGVAADPNLNQEDGIHPTAEGYVIIVDNIYPYVETAIAEFEAGQ